MGHRPQKLLLPPVLLRQLLNMGLHRLGHPVKVPGKKPHLVLSLDRGPLVISPVRNAGRRLLQLPQGPEGPPEDQHQHRHPGHQGHGSRL